MYRRLAAHYIYYNGLYRMHYIEVDGEDRATGLYPLIEEIAGTAFYNGLLLAVPRTFTSSSLLEQQEKWSKQFPSLDVLEIMKRGDAALAVLSESPIHLYHLPNPHCFASEFGADNCGGNGYIQRL